MLDFDAGKLMVIGVVALVVIAPKDLPRVLRTVGSTVAKLRRMASEFQGQFMEAMREAEMTDVKEEMGKIADSAKINVAFDPIRDIRNQISGAIAGETTVQALPPDTVLPESPAAGIDLSHVSTATGPAADDAGGLVATGIAPGLEAPADEVTAAPATAATLDDVRQALGEEMNNAGPDGHVRTPEASRDAHQDAHPVKEPTA